MKTTFISKKGKKICMVLCFLLIIVAAVVCWPKFGRPLESIDVDLVSSSTQQTYAGGWSRKVKPNPSFSHLSGIREWSPEEIAYRHREVLGQELPHYVTDVRGFGPITETVESVPRWFFVVPKENIADFKDYLMAIGLPKVAFYKRAGKEKFPPPYDDERWDPPAPIRFPKLFYLDTQRYLIDEDLFGMLFGPASSSYTYKFYSPNTAFRVIMSVGWESGNVRISLGDVRRRDD